MSDHSSHFDSVSGTAINLGMHSVNEKGSLHYPKVVDHGDHSGYHAGDHSGDHAGDHDHALRQQEGLSPLSQGVSSY